MEGGHVFLVVAYAVIFLGLFAYIVSVAARQRKVNSALKRLQDRQKDNSAG